MSTSSKESHQTFDEYEIRDMCWHWFVTDAYIDPTVRNIKWHGDSQPIPRMEGDEKRIHNLRKRAGRDIGSFSVYVRVWLF
jgi:hypothetical protein